ncbi:MAG: hypothetical protein LBL91_05585 [Lachnospiraceae bacterium]|nr:hypothetical protein [Lachnospiraceae bacterium]
MEFKRGLDDTIIKDLKQASLFNNKIKKDIQEGDVFPAIRENRIDFYYYNSKLFSYDKKFKTHSKFAFVPTEYKPDYVTEGQSIGADNKIASFEEGYKNIKERAKLYSTLEATGVHDICKNGNIVRYNNLEYMVLDIEIAFTKTKEEISGTIEQEEKQKKQNRIDLLLYNIKEQELLFVEAKHFSNKEIRPDNDKKLDVANQIARYNKEITDHSSEILSVYKKYIQDINTIFELTLPEPKSIYAECGLVIFGFDDIIRDRYLKKEVNPALENSNVKFYEKGDSKKIDIKTLYEAIRNS